MGPRTDLWIWGRNVLGGGHLLVGAASQLGSWQLENICICKKYLNYYQNYLRPNWINQVQHETGYCWGSITTWELCSACSISIASPWAPAIKGGGRSPQHNANVVTISHGERPATGHPLALDMSGLDLIPRCRKEAVMTSSPVTSPWWVAPCSRWAWAETYKWVFVSLFLRFVSIKCQKCGVQWSSIPIFWSQRSKVLRYCCLV